MEHFGLEIDDKNLPAHIGIIMDGNGRWAKRKNLDRIMGHDKGYKVLKRIIDFNKFIGVKYITVYAFSTENWKRPENEVNFLMELAKKLVIEYTETLLKNDIRLMITGTEDNLSKDLLLLLQSSIDRTSHCKRYTLNIAFNYGGRKEILDAVKKIAVESGKDSSLIENLDEDNFRKYLYHSDLPDVDLMIRTSGEIRTSNFLLWQSAYSELWFTKKLWPDFTPKDYCKAIVDYQKRQRRFGSV